MTAFFIIGILYAGYILFTILTALSSIKRGEKNSTSEFIIFSLLFSEIIFTIIGPILGFWRFDEFGPEIPFAKKHVLSIILLVITSSVSFWLAKFTNKTAHPLIRIVLSVGMLQGIILCGITTIHFIAFFPLGIIYPTAGFELLSPLVAFFLLIREFYFYNKVELDMEELVPYHKQLGFVPLPHKVFQLPMLQRLMIYLGLVMMVVIGQALLAYAAGQEIDSIIKAFTHSVGFVFSMRTS